MTLKYLHNLLLYLPLVIAAILVAQHFFRKISHKVASRKKTSCMMHVFAQLPLGSKEKLMLVDINGTRVLLGVTKHNISNLLMMDGNLTALRDFSAATVTDNKLWESINQVNNEQ